QLWLGRFDSTGRNGVFDSQVRIGGIPADPTPWSLQAPIGATRRNTVWLDSDVLSGQRWGRLDLASAGHIALDGTLTLQEAGHIALDGTLTLPVSASCPP
ncbi:hypothetical protein EN803_40810, partial [Mesorhizobium sp. M2D.F.Ca.ET.160.01.1.1]